MLHGKSQTKIADGRGQGRQLDFDLGLAALPGDGEKPDGESIGG